MEPANSRVEEQSVLRSADLEDFRRRDAELEECSLGAEGVDVAFGWEGIAGVSVSRVVFFTDVEDGASV